MRRFHSYGPVNEKRHFAVPRKALVKTCFESLVGDSEEGGHYFTIWAPRQTGKTWLMRQVKKEIENHYGDRFIVGTMSVQGVVIKEGDPDEIFLKKVPQLVWETFKIDMHSPPESWENLKDLFSQRKDIFNRPVILFIDEFDSLPPKVIDRLVTLFRDMYLKHDSYMLHGLALIGVRAVLGVESLRGSPFNIQRSLHVPNFSREEVEELYQQYQNESGQTIEPGVVENVFESTRGQPGLVSWFGELLTEKYNPGKGNVLDVAIWDHVFEAALHKEWNNTILNLIKKAQGMYANYVVELFSKSDMPFNIRTDWCSYLYLNGIIDENSIIDSMGRRKFVCRFASPFVQACLYNAMTYDLIGDRTPILVLDPLDDLSDIFERQALNLPPLLRRYIDYLDRLKIRGLNPWKEQPRRADLHLTEAVGHFHLYAWLKEAIGRRCVISPEFPTGNGKVDLHLRCNEKQGIIEVKSFVDFSELKRSRKQAAEYAGSLELDEVTIALFVPVTEEDVLEKLSGEHEIDGIKVQVKAIGWEI
ncbi:MAG: AAA-like domain-containing protein [Thermodesulfobacteriota bacterium]|nr:AAA-like domain-containing protein [Thermodesulfobacteriota bacterium]